MPWPNQAMGFCPVRLACLLEDSRPRRCQEELRLMEEAEAEKVGGPQMRGVSMWQPSRYHINVRNHML